MSFLGSVQCLCLFPDVQMMLSILLLVLLSSISTVSPLVQNKPNFVLMMVDDLGIGDLGCYGNSTLRTPHIDRLSQEGVKLTHHVAASPLCSPSRAAFLTGRYPIRSGVSGTLRPGVFIFTGSSGGLPQTELTFATIAQQQGYDTALIGKWHLGLNCDRHDDHCHHPHSHGFRYFFGVPLTNLRDCGPGHGTVFMVHRYLPYASMSAAATTVVALHYGGAVRVGRRTVLVLLGLVGMAVALMWAVVTVMPYMNCVLMRNERIVEQPFTAENLTQMMTREAIEFIYRSSSRPFLLFLSFLQVHTAMFASPPFRGSSPHGVYGDAVHEVDWSVGQSICLSILQTLDHLGLSENTLVYLTSDQGPHLEEISASGEVHGGSNGGFKAGKSTNWEGGIRVPGLVRWTGRIPPGVEVDQPTSNMDLFPTLVRLSGATVPQDRPIDGLDLMSLLEGTVQRSGHDFLFHYCNSYLNAVRWNPPNGSSVYKAFFFTPDFYPDSQTGCFHTHVCFCTPGHVTYHDPPLLFDLSKDPSETTPLTPDTDPAYGAILEAMKEAELRHRRSVTPVESQMSLGHLMWKPWLQPCCSSFSRLCRCDQDQ
uniref:Sulfatase N-terminal domain-containing protein n=1 Tax=Sphaeramia orbicularis TaxID=375764 RepID=A0A672YWH4_9TELE